ncbi:Imm41 family immunity protein [Shewanella sp. HL-SH5]|uniref:Imm41 family immunity protein n=1 Tax=Shewanella sp. HL-SH5 TaxID=3436241 RepID=UPI003EB826C1
MMQNILLNFPHCDDFDDHSFVGIWHESGKLDFQKYWEFEREVFELANEQSASELPRDIAWPIMRIFSYIMTGIQAHYNVNDGFELLDLEDNELHEFRERFQCVVEGFFKGSMPENTDFELMNPLMQNT